MEVMMKKQSLVGLLIFLVLSACAPATPPPTPTPTPVPSCAKTYCIQDVYLSLQDGTLLIQLAMTDPNGEVPIGFDAVPEDDILAAIFLTNEDPEFYLIGFKVPTALLDCYTGNDVPWTNGTLGRACSFTVPASSLAKQIQINDPIRAEVDIIPSMKPAFNKPVLWLNP